MCCAEKRQSGLFSAMSTTLEIRQLILEMSLANPLWGAPRIHGELLKLGIDVGQTSVAKYMARHRKPDYTISMPGFDLRQGQGC
jgi:hypothetical protein